MSPRTPESSLPSFEPIPTGDTGREAMRGVLLQRLLPAHAIGAALVVTILAPVISWHWLAGWLVLLALVLAATTRFDSRHWQQGLGESGAAPRPATIVSVSLVQAVVWTLPLILFSSLLDSRQCLEVWAVIAAISAMTVFLRNALQPTTLVFGLVLGAAAGAAFMAAGAWLDALLAVGVAAITAFGGLAASRVDAAMADQSEVVSLLLREFDGRGSDWLWQVDQTGKITQASPRFAAALGAAPEAVEGQSLLRWIGGEGGNGEPDASLRELATRLRRRSSFAHLVVRATVEGQTRWWNLSASPRFDLQGHFIGFRGVGSDVTEQRESVDRIVRLARTDSLTGLPNRTMLFDHLGDRLHKSAATGQPCALLMVDLDRFKPVNDSLGHQVGDRLLAQVAQRLADLVGSEGQCGRLGGDEFAVVLADCADAASVEAMARHIIEGLSQAFDVDHHRLFIGASIGSAIAPRDGRTIETLQRHADLALYRAKEQGRGLHCAYVPALQALAEERKILEGGLRQALENDEFDLVFQPVLSVRTGRIAGFEALLRWTFGERGEISPARFIPLAADTRLIVPIGEWVLRRACAEAAHWPTSVSLSINVAVEQLRDAGFVEAVVQALAQSNLAAARLSFDVSEAIFDDDSGMVRQNLQRLRALGCGVALDDFGAGSCAIGGLARAGLSAVKLDRRLVRDAARLEADSLAIVCAVLALAEALGMESVAEGVETEQEMALVHKLGMTRMQGRLVALPIDARTAREIFADDVDDHHDSEVRRGAA